MRVARAGRPLRVARDRRSSRHRTVEPSPRRLALNASRARQKALPLATYPQVFVRNLEATPEPARRLSASTAAYLRLLRSSLSSERALVACPNPIRSGPTRARRHPRGVRPKALQPRRPAGAWDTSLSSGWSLPNTSRGTFRNEVPLPVCLGCNSSSLESFVVGLLDCDRRLCGARILSNFLENRPQHTVHRPSATACAALTRSHRSPRNEVDELPVCAYSTDAFS
jgi:hypothetical protein